jgi:hypothetical protein
MGKYPKGTRLRLVQSPIDGYRDIGEEFEAADDYGPMADMNRERPDYLQAYVDRRGRVTHCPTENFEPVGPVRTVTRQEIIPGTYDGVSVQRYAKDPSGVIRVSLFAHDEMHRKMTADELDRAAAVLTALAGALRDAR